MKYLIIPTFSWQYLGRIVLLQVTWPDFLSILARQARKNIFIKVKTKSIYLHAVINLYYKYHYYYYCFFFLIFIMYGNKSQISVLVHWYLLLLLYCYVENTLYSFKDEYVFFSVSLRTITCDVVARSLLVPAVVRGLAGREQRLCWGRSVCSFPVCVVNEHRLSHANASYWTTPEKDSNI